MNSTLQRTRHWYSLYLRFLSWLQNPFLLACRLYWGGLFISTGYGKLTHLALTSQRFADWHIPAPYPNALAAGTTELLCGALLVLGAASRFVTVPLIVTMIVAYRTAHVDDVTDLYTFVTAPPFLHLFACTLVLLFGPGAFSIDCLVRKFIWGSSCASRPTTDASCEIKISEKLPKDLQKGAPS